jgi:cysteinyl-tRNA synthetase
MAQLNCLPPTAEPRATEYIPEMIATIQRIMDNGHAYAVEGGDVYFEVATLPGYGKLSGRAQEDNRWGRQAGESEIE